MALTRVKSEFIKPTITGGKVCSWILKILIEKQNENLKHQETMFKAMIYDRNISKMLQASGYSQEQTMTTPDWETKAQMHSTPERYLISEAYSPITNISCY